VTCSTPLPFFSRSTTSVLGSGDGSGRGVGLSRGYGRRKLTLGICAFNRRPKAVFKPALLVSMRLIESLSLATVVADAPLVVLFLGHRT
jgi:hypothetical protein